MSRLTAILKIFAFFPPILLLAGSFGVVACGKGLFSTSTASNTATATSTSTASTMAFVTNFNTGKISEFKRNTTTGNLVLQGTIKAGSKQGPKGMAIDPTGSFLYAANFADGNIEEYTINSNATLTANGTVSDGSGSGPSLMTIGTTTSGTFLWVTNESNGTISEWSINTTSGALTNVGTVSGVGLQGPFGLVISADGSTLFVSDNTAGLIFTFTINTDGTLTINGSPVPNLNGTAKGSPGMMAIDPTGDFLYVTDIAKGVVSMFNVSSLPMTAGGNYPSTFTTNTGTIGIGTAILASVNYVITTNQQAGNTWAFQIQASGALTLPPNSAGTVSSPTGMAIDPTNSYLYTANQSDSTVGIFKLNAACPSTIQPVCPVTTKPTQNNPPSGGTGPFFVVLN